MLRKLFDDEILKEYSYVGQKKKRIFSSLKTCTVIFGKHYVYIIKLFFEVPINYNMQG